MEGSKTSVDFGKLRKDFARAKAKDDRYSRENDAKFRAVNQRVATYDEFKEIVDAAHLQPLAKDDRLQSIPKQTWNVAASKTSQTAFAPDEAASPGAHHSIHKSAMESSDLPKTSHAFNKLWRTSRPQERYRLLVADVDSFIHFMVPEMSSDLLVEIVSVLDELSRIEDIPQILNLLERLSETRRFSLNLDFMSSQERLKVTTLFRNLHHMTSDSISTAPPSDTAAAAANNHCELIAPTHQLDVLTVAKCYGVNLPTAEANVT